MDFSTAASNPVSIVTMRLDLKMRTRYLVLRKRWVMLSVRSGLQ